MINRNAPLPPMLLHHGIKVLGTQDTVALHSVVVRAAQAGQKSKTWDSDVAPPLRLSLQRRALIPACILRPHHGPLERVWVRAVRVPPVEPADGTRAAARQHRPPLHRRPQRRVHAEAGPPVDCEERVAPADDDDVGGGESSVNVAPGGGGVDEGEGGDGAARGLEARRLPVLRAREVVGGRAEVEDRGVGLAGEGDDSGADEGVVEAVAA
mmetsp:Transcript_49220/g.123029  ORF Transcript_49220/g.123029 Transcript_49220/m.123029 type:complete len:211 (-) Transcript_49220:279-911(-)